MKQNPTKKQWDEINYEQKATFCNRLDSDTYYVNPPSIGQMIEFIESKLTESKFTWCDFIDWDGKGGLCDDLWGNVKSFLNKEKKCLSCGKQLT